MLLDAKQTTLAYRCPHCAAGVMSAVNFFALSADMIKLKCTCGESELTAVLSTSDKKVRLTVPCIVCTKPHTFTVNESLFFGKELFALSCPYSDLPLAFFGETNQVKAELARSELELMDLMEKSGLESLEQLHRAEEEALPDPQILDIVMFVINDLDAEGKIYCKCDQSENGRQYDAEITAEGVRVCCRKCMASRLIPTDSSLSAHAFLNADALHLE